MPLPPEDTYRPLTREMHLPAFTAEDLTSFLQKYGITKTENSEAMYVNVNLLQVKCSSVQDGVFLRAKCNSQTKDDVIYGIDMYISNCLQIIYTHCECANGRGPYAHCKHIVTLLLAILQHTYGKEILTKESRIRTLYSRRSSLKTKKKGSESAVIFDPRPKDLRNRSWYRGYFRNLVINYQSTNKKMPISELYGPANPHGINCDHDYMEVTPADYVLERLKLTKLSPGDISMIEMETRGRHRNPKWFAEQRLRIPTSEFGKICKTTDKNELVVLANKLVHPRKKTSKSILHERANDTEWLDLYENAMQVKVESCGIILNSAFPYLCSSPGGLVGEHKLVEVKSPYSSRKCKITSVTVPYLQQDGGSGLTLSEKHDFYYGVQGALLVTEREQCDFVVNTEMETVIIEVERKEEFIAQMLKNLILFFEMYMKPAILQKHFYKEFDNYSFQ